MTVVFRACHALFGLFLERSFIFDYEIKAQKCWDKIWIWLESGSILDDMITWLSDALFSFDDMVVGKWQPTESDNSRYAYLERKINQEMIGGAQWFSDKKAMGRICLKRFDGYPIDWTIPW